MGVDPPSLLSHYFSVGHGKDDDGVIEEAPAPAVRTLDKRMPSIVLTTGQDETERLGCKDLIEYIPRKDHDRYGYSIRKPDDGRHSIRFHSNHPLSYLNNNKSPRICQDHKGICLTGIKATAGIPTA